jgi:hypothetical protein
VSRRLLALLAPVLLVAAAVAGCGGSSQTDIGPYQGTWQRVEAGAPDPGFTLTIARHDESAVVTFANRTNGMSESVPATAEDGYLACTLPSGETGLPAQAGAPVESDLQLSLDENGQLVVDLVLGDGTLEPVWIYDRGAASSPAEP